MEADPLKNKDCVSQWVAEAPPGCTLASASKTDNKVDSSLDLNWANSKNRAFCEQFTSLHTSANSNILGGDIALSGNMVHSQTFQETKPLNDLATSDRLPHVLPTNHTGVFPASPNNEFLGISCPSTAASPPLVSQEAMFVQNRERNPVQQEQLLIRQMEHLQRMVTEQQKIISFYSPASCLETLPAIEEEQEEQQIDGDIAFGINTKTRKVDDRPFSPETGVSQKMSDKFVEKQLKVNSQRTEKKQKNSCETKVAAQKLFLKHNGGMERLRKNKENPGKQQANPLRRVSFDCQNPFAWRAHCDTEKILGKHPQLKRQVSSPTMLLMDDKNTNYITSKDVKCQFNSLEQRPEEREGSSNTGGYEGEEMVNKKEPDVRSLMNCTECLQECHEQINEIKAKENDKTDMSCLCSQDHIDGDNSRSVDTKVTVWHKENLEDSESQVAGWPTEASRNTSEVLNLKENQTDLVNQNSRLQIVQTVNDRSAEIKIESGPAFKKVSDQIVKVTSTAIMANSQRKQHHGAGAAGRWRRSPPSNDSVFTSTDSDDEPKSHWSQYPVRPNTHRATNTGQNLDLSDGDYATDEPSGPEDRKYPAKKSEVQELAGQQEASLITGSSGDPSAGVGSLKGRKIHSPLRKSPFHSSKTAKDGREPETWRKGSASHSTECSLQPLSLTRDLMASLFPAFKTKASVEDEKAALEQVKERPSDKLEEWQGDVQVQHQETSLLAQMKEEQAKAMAFLRRQINQLEVTQPQTLHYLEEGKSEEAVEPQKKNEGCKKHLVKEERESAEIKMLRQQISGLQEEIRRNESHWHAAHGELRSQVEALTKQNLQLQDELRVSKHQRMEAKRRQEPLVSIEREAEVLATRSSLKRSESLKSTSGTHREKSPPKTLHTQNVTPTDTHAICVLQPGFKKFMA
ncbi:centromere protein J-like [Heteronotia binoei]|uniref:centromere protein J-like n=1 Tax=Heteronotia binoei TaxID=13085 RepID=UPI00293019A7|nr:centromere protein J-like [Heteronotia binoei]